MGCNGVTKGKRTPCFIGCGVELAPLHSVWVELATKQMICLLPTNLMEVQFNTHKTSVKLCVKKINDVSNEMWIISSLDTGQIEVGEVMWITLSSLQLMAFYLTFLWFTHYK